MEIPSSPEVSTQSQAQPATTTPTTGKDFASLHAAAVAREKTSSQTTPANERIDAPEGETWSAEKAGTHYARIVTGPRTGQYINLTHGARRGQTFTIENRDGKNVHVYGSGSNEVVVKAATDASATTKAAKQLKHAQDQPPKGEKWAPVEGHSTYADILEGPRNGQYVNISGGMRDGMAFQIIKKGDKTFHVYGTGKHKQTIEVGAAKKAASASSASTSGSTGGTAAGSGTSATATGTGGTNAATG